jgi:glucose-6-phosphate isomerase
LYLDGPKNKIFNIFSIKQNLAKKVKIKKINKETNFLDNKKLQDVKDAQKTALIEVFKQNNIPFREFQIRALNEETLGELFSYFILETIITGKLININPYDQPDVEKVKVLTKKILN